MAHDVFISYSSRDKPIADAACAALEARGVRCWIAPRDIPAGMEWAESIMAAIHESRVLLLVFSANANQSQQVRREVERGVSTGLPIIPLRVEDVAPSQAMEYFLGSVHWLDARTPPLERHLQHLAETVQLILARTAPEAVPVGATLRVTSPAGGERWPAGTEQTISWEASAGPGSPLEGLELALYRGDARVVTILEQQLPPAGAERCLWTIPAGLAVGESYRVGLSVRDAAGRVAAATSGRPFAIAAPPDRLSAWRRRPGSLSAGSA
jgi:hypothetical protein